VLQRDERGLPSDLQLLHGPRVAVRIAEAEEGAAIALVEDHDVAAGDATADQLIACGACVRDHELQALDRAGLHLVLRRQVADHDGATRATWRQLDDMHVLVAGVVIKVESDLVPVEGHRAVDVGDGHDDDFEGPVHSRIMPATAATVSRRTVLTMVRMSLLRSPLLEAWSE
jgi:hypothetical protein